MSPNKSVEKTCEDQARHIATLEARVLELEQEVGSLAGIQNAVASLAREIAGRVAELEAGSS